MNNKKRIYDIIEVSRNNDFASKLYDMMMLITVFVGFIPLTMKQDNLYSKSIDIVSALIFLFDYSIRLYTSDYKMGVKSYKAYLAYMLTPMAIVDLLSTIPLLFVFFPASTFLGMFRLIRVLRVLKLIRYSKTMVTIANVLRNVKNQLMAVLILTAAYILSSAMMIFQLEPDLFENFFDAIYWATISITTIGYGDIVPKTTIGRMITMFSALVGVAVIALPSGIITAAYMDEIKKKKSKHQL